MAVIENPILNSPFREPARHFKFDEEGITDEILSGRRPSSHFVPIPRAKKKGKQLQFETERTKDRIESFAPRAENGDRLRQDRRDGDAKPSSKARPGRRRSNPS